MDLATELLHEIKRESRRRFIALIICIVLLFVSNIAWLIAWNLPTREVTSTEEYELQGEDNSNVILNNGEGDVRIGEDKGKENNNGQGTDEQNEKP